jgi:hypothetical protein
LLSATGDRVHDVLSIVGFELVEPRQELRRESGVGLRHSPGERQGAVACYFVFRQRDESVALGRRQFAIFQASSRAPRVVE